MSDPMAVSRRLVAVFAADVEGYSRLMGADEVGILRRRAISGFGAWKTSHCAGTTCASRALALMRPRFGFTIPSNPPNVGTR